MKKEEKIAICRIFTDLIKADGIIDSGEMRQYAMLRDRYGLCKEEEIAAANHYCPVKNGNWSLK